MNYYYPQTPKPALTKGAHGLYTQHIRLWEDTINRIIMPCICNFQTITPYEPPVPFFQSKRPPGLEENGTTARDMTYNDYSEAQMVQLLPVEESYEEQDALVDELYQNANEGPNWFISALRMSLAADVQQNIYTNRAINHALDINEPLLDSSADALFEEFRSMANRWFAGGEGADYVHALIDHFQGGTGEKFSHDLLTKDAIEHKSTQEFLENLDDHVKQVMKDRLSFNEIFNIPGINRGWDKPAFNSFFGDTLWGNITIAVNDIWGYKIDVIAYEERETNYCLELEITLYDHFGLDETDISSVEVLINNVARDGKGNLYGMLNGFRAWFILQHYQGFNGQFKPFITEMKWRRTYQGEFK